MSMEILTKEDLIQFKQELFSELRSALSIQKPLKRWLKSSEVKVILDCSAGTQS
jgi:hypothetical protein